MEAAAVNVLPTNKPIISRTMINSDEYITGAEEIMFEAHRYIENHSPQTSIISATVASNVSEPRGQNVSSRPITHDDSGLWFVRLEYVFLLWDYVTNKHVCGSHNVVDRRIAYVVRDNAGVRASCERIRHGKDAFRPTVRARHSSSAHT